MKITASISQADVTSFDSAKPTNVSHSPDSLCPEGLPVQWVDRLVASTLFVVVGLAGIGLNRSVMIHLSNNGAKYKFINTIIYFICLVGYAFGFLQIGTVLWIWAYPIPLSPWLGYAYWILVIYLSSVMSTLIMMIAIARYLYVFKEAAIRELREDDQLARTVVLIAGNISLVVTLISGVSLHNTHIIHLWNDQAREHVEINAESSALIIRRVFLVLVLIMLVSSMILSHIIYRRIAAFTPSRRRSVSAAFSSVHGLATHFGSILEQRTKRIQNFVSSYSHRRLSILCSCSFIPPIIFHFLEPICLDRLLLWAFMLSHLFQISFPCLVPALIHILDNTRLRREHLGIVGINPYQVPSGPEVNDHLSLVNLLQRKQIDKLSIYTIPVAAKWNRKQPNRVEPLNAPIDMGPGVRQVLPSPTSLNTPMSTYALHMPKFVTSSIFPLEISMMPSLYSGIEGNGSNVKKMYQHVNEGFNYPVWDAPSYTGKKLARIIGGEFLEEKEGAIARPF